VAERLRQHMGNRAIENYRAAGETPRSSMKRPTAQHCLPETLLDWRKDLVNAKGIRRPKMRTAAKPP